MAASPTDPSSGPESFDPYRRRREIEAMEQRFRERAERHGGGPVATGEIDQRVADEMKEFFGDVGEGHAAGVWEDTPRENVAFREKYKKQIEAQAKKRKAEEMI